jgi:succinate dehydrogenase / fumarate reductase cytochrome b subunit
MDRYGDRRLWILQRISAIFVAVFVLAHLWELRLQRLIFGLPADALYTTLTAHLSWTWGGIPLIALGYIAGIAAVLFHFANGLYAATSAWGVAIDSAGRRRVRRASIAIAALLFVIGTATVIGLATGTRLFGHSGENGVAPQAPCGGAGAPPQSPLRFPAPGAVPSR